MLTKEEREKIAERFISYDGNKLYFAELFKCLFGREIPRDATTKGSAKTVIDRLIDLCDTSNMVELPLDKDGEVIHINDVIYDNSGEEYQVECIKFFDIGASVAIRNDDDYTITQPGRITHKNPVTAKSLAQRIKHVLEGEATSIGVNPYVELGRIAEQLESLGDSND
jgi:hypothetical protein